MGGEYVEEKAYRVPRIVFFLPTPGGLTGAPRRLLTLMIALRNSLSFDVALIGDFSDRLTQEAAQRGIKIIEVPRGSILSLKHGTLLTGSIGFRIKVIKELKNYNLNMARALREYNPDVIWIRGSKGIAFGGLAVFLLRRPLIWDIDYEPPSQGLVAWLHDLGLWLSTKVVLQYIAAGERIFGTDRVEQYKKKFVSIIPGIDFERLRPYREYRSRKSSSETSCSKVFRILQVGTICNRKNQRFTLRVMYELKRLCPHLKFELWFAGDEYEADYAEAVRREIYDFGLRDNVKLLGWRDDVPELLSRADLLMLPSKDEGVPNVVQEAMYIGCPVIASDVGGIPEIINDEQTGWVLPISSPSLWAEKIFRLMQNPKKLLEISKKAAFFAEQKFSLDNWVNKYADIFYDVLN